MNEIVRPPKASPSPPGPPITGRDREFLPAAIELLETPPAPLPVALMLILCGFLAVGLVWACIGQLEVLATAQGKIEAIGGTQVIQPLDPGKVARVWVENGQRVETGDLLVEFDRTEAAADAEALAETLTSLQAEVERRSAGAEMVGSQDAVDSPIPVRWADDIPADVRQREQTVLTADLKQLRDQLADLDRQIAQRRASRARLEASIGFELKLVATLNDRVSMRDTLVKVQAGPRTNLFDAQETLQRAQAALASDQGQLGETDSAVNELEAQKTRTVSQFVDDYENKKADASRNLATTEKQLAKARAKLSRTKLTAPTDGTVQELALTTVGQVVTPGQQLLVLVPTNRALQVEVYMSNSDIGFVSVGQEAAIKVDAFPFTRYGTLNGHVTKIASDAVDEQDARRAQANATSLVAAANTNPPTGQPQNFVFPVTLSLDETAIKADRAFLPVTPGMTVTAEIKTEKRRVIDYLLSPLAKVASESLKER